MPLPQARESGLYENPETRERIREAVLACAGEIGYRKLTVAAVLARYGGHRLQFYHHFANVQECYAEAYEAQAERLARRLLAAGAAAESWRPGLRASLEELADFATADPPLASGLLIQVHVAGGPALERRKEVLERLSSTLDSARRETGSRHSPPPLTAPLMVSAIEAAVARVLRMGQPERLRTETMPEIEHLISSLYFGHGPQPA